MSGGGSGGGQSTQTIQKSEPWSGVQPYLSGMYNYAYNQAPRQYYPGQQVADVSDNQRQALSAGWNLGMNGDPTMNAAEGYAQGAMNGDYLNSNPANGFFSDWQNGNRAQSDALPFYQDWQNGQGPQSPAGQFFSNWADGQGTQSPVGQYFSTLSNTGGADNWAKGYFSNLMNSSRDETQNPFLSGMVKAATRGMNDEWQNTVAPGVASMFGANGRTGSGAMGADLMAKASPLMNSVQDVTQNIYGHAYDTDAARRDAAAGQVSGMFNTMANRQDSASAMVNNLYNTYQDRRFAGAAGINDIYNQYQNRRFAGAAGVNDLYNQYNANQFAGAQGLSNNHNFERNMQNSAMQFAPAAQAAAWQNVQGMMGVGDFWQQQAQNQINANKQAWDFNQNEPMQHASFLNSILNGGLNFGTQTGSSNQQMQSPSNPFMGALGGGLMGASMGGMAGGIGAFPGAMIGGGLGLLGGGLFH